MFFVFVLFFVVFVVVVVVVAVVFFIQDKLDCIIIPNYVTLRGSSKGYRPCK